MTQGSLGLCFKDLPAPHLGRAACPQGLQKPQCRRRKYLEGQESHSATLGTSLPVRLRKWRIIQEVTRFVCFTQTSAPGSSNNQVLFSWNAKSWVWNVMSMMWWGQARKGHAGNEATPPGNLDPTKMLCQLMRRRISYIKQLQTSWFDSNNSTSQCGFLNFWSFKKASSTGVCPRSRWWSRR